MTAPATATTDQTLPTLTAADPFGRTPEAFQYRVLRSMRRIDRVYVDAQYDF